VRIGGVWHIPADELDALLHPEGQASDP
jgi:hypothetical protein